MYILRSNILRVCSIIYKLHHMFCLYLDTLSGKNPFYVTVAKLDPLFFFHLQRCWSNLHHIISYFAFYVDEGSLIIVTIQQFSDMFQDDHVLYRNRYKQFWTCSFYVHYLETFTMFFYFHTLNRTMNNESC